MLINLLLVVPLFLGHHLIGLNWSEKDSRTEVDITVLSRDQILDNCAQSGIEVHYRFQVKLCRRRSWWTDSCSDMQQFVRTMQFDPISENFRMLTDKMGDDLDPEVFYVDSLATAFETLSTLKRVSLPEITEQSSYKPGPRDYLSVKLLSECKGEYSRIATRISTVITLGLINVGRFDSGWIDFAMQEDAINKGDSR